MKKIKLSFAVFTLTVLLSACGLTGITNQKEYAANMAKAIGAGNLQEAAALDPQLNEWCSNYITNATEAEKVKAFLIDMVKKVEENEQGSIAKIMLLLNSNDDKLAGIGLTTGREKLLAQIEAYAGTLAPKAVFDKIYKEY